MEQEADSVGDHGDELNSKIKLNSDVIDSEKIVVTVQERPQTADDDLKLKNYKGRGG